MFASRSSRDVKLVDESAGSTLTAIWLVASAVSAVLQISSESSGALIDGGSRFLVVTKGEFDGFGFLLLRRLLRVCFGCFA